MPRMSDLESKMWRERSAHADHVWKEKGLTVAQPAKYGETSIFTHMDAYRGDQWKTIGELNGIAPEAHLVINAVFATLNTMQAQHLSRNPKVRVFPRSAAHAEKAPKFKAYLNYLVEEAKLMRSWNAAMRDAFYRVGFVRVGYTPPEEVVAKDKVIERGPSAMDIPWMRRIAPWDIRIDPLAESWHADADGRWCEFISVITFEELKANPGMKVPDDLRAKVGDKNRSGSGFISKDKRERDSRRINDPYMYEAANLLEVRSVYDAVERKWFQWTPASEKNLRDPDDWPISLQGIEGLPYTMLAFNEQSDDPCPLGYADVLWPLQVERNKVRTILNELTKRMRRIIVANGAAFSDDDKSKIANTDLVEVLFTQGAAPTNEVIAQIGIAGFDQTLLLYDQMIQTDIRETIGQSQMARGQRINVTSATEAASVAQGDTTLSGRNQSAVDVFLRDSVRLYAKVVQGSATDEVLIPVLGAEDAASLMAGQDPVLRISPEDIKGEFLFEIEVGSTLPRDERQEVAKEMAWLQVAQQFPQNTNIPDALAKLALAMGKNPREALMNAQQQRATDAAVPGTTPVEPGRGSGGIDPRAMMAAQGGMQ